VAVAAHPGRPGNAGQTAGPRAAPTQITIAVRTIVLFVAIAFGSFLLLAFVYAARAVLVQFVVAIVLALAAEPLVQAFERRGLPRSTAVGISFALALLAAIALAYLLIAPLVDETTRLVDDAPELARELSEGNGRLGFLETRFHIVERVREATGSSLADSAAPVVGMVSSAVETGAAILFVVFLTLFVQLGGRQWFESLVALAPDHARARIRRAGGGVSKAVGGYVTGNLLISAICGAVTTVVLAAASVPYPLALGLVVAVFDLIPMVGATSGTIIVAGVALSTEGFVTAAVVVAAMFLYQKVENNVLQQLVYHRTVRLSPLAIALSVAIGAEVGGVVGALLGIPFAGALKVVGAELVAWRRGEEA
jgi:predicted PurR-regulated permease PerM